jgi:Protein of unknown function (DUF3558)
LTMASHPGRLTELSSAGADRSGERVRRPGRSRYGREMRRLVLIAAVLAGVAGCAVPVAGTPAVDPAVPVSSRPREIRLEKVDPCSVLTDAQRKGFGVDSKPLSSPGGLNNDDAICDWIGFEPRAVGAHIKILTRGGIELYDVTSGRVSAKPIKVAGFPALLMTLTGHPEDCAVGIDVAEGQALDLVFSDAGRKPPVPQADLCRDAQAMAETVIQNLLARG